MGKKPHLRLRPPSISQRPQTNQLLSISAIAFPNGTTLTVAKTLGDDTYAFTLRRLSLPSSQHLA